MYAGKLHSHPLYEMCLFETLVFDVQNLALTDNMVQFDLTLHAELPIKGMSDNCQNHGIFWEGL